MPESQRDDVRTLLPERIMTEGGLCERFDKDILYDAHGLAQRINRSEAAKELMRRGRITLSAIADHLREHQKLDEVDLRQAWHILLFWMADVVAPDSPHPEVLDETSDWIAWAEQHAIYEA